MKRMMAIFFSGCILAGIGIGVTVLEFRNWTVTDFRPDMTTGPVENHEETFMIDMSQHKYLEIDCVNYHYIINVPQVNPEYDRQCTDTVRIAVEYRGKRPAIYLSGWWQNADTTTTAGIWVDTRSHNNMAEMLEILEEIFETKTYYTYPESTRIEKITVYTAYPEKVVFR